MKSQWAPLLKQIRVCHQITQGTLAHHLCCSRSYVSEIEAGKKRPSPAILETYCQTFGFRMSEIHAAVEVLSGQHPQSRGLLGNKMAAIISVMEQTNDPARD